MTFVPVNLKKVEQDELSESINKWRSKEGWIFPDVKTSMQCNRHPRQLDQASLDKLKEVSYLNLSIFSENIAVLLDL